MPKIVDSDEKRRQIVTGYLELVRRDGIGAVTSRSLAAYLGMSNSLLWRYFHGMNDLLSQAYMTVVDHSDQRINAAIAEHQGIDAVRAMLDEMLPLTDESKAEAQVVVGFWGLAVIDAHGHAPSVLFEVRRWTTLMARLLDEAATAGEVFLPAGPAQIAELMVSDTVETQIEYAIHRDSDIVARRRETLLSVLRGNPRYDAVHQ